MPSRDDIRADARATGTRASAVPESAADARSTWAALGLAMRSWRTAAVSLLSFSSGMPLGLVWIAIPTWLAREGIDIRLIGLVTLAQAPWSLKFLWAPLLDRYAPPFPPIGRKLAWAALAQIALLGLTLALAGIEPRETLYLLGVVTLAIGFVAASQDIVIDAYAVEVLEPAEQAIAVGARVAIYRAALFVAGGLTISLAGLWSWPVLFWISAALYLPMLGTSLLAPRSPVTAARAPRSLRDAVLRPLSHLLRRRRALEMLAFVLLYKLADNLAGALVRPFLVEIGFSDFDVGVATSSIGLVATLAGTFAGGVLTTTLGLGRALWVFGVLQIASNLGYVAIAEIGPSSLVMYVAMGFESLTSGMGTGAFGVLLLRLTEREFSATQYALLSSLFALPRLLGGPVAGFCVDAIGWRDFFLVTIASGLPGMLMLQRFSPLGTREPGIDLEPGT